MKTLGIIPARFASTRFPGKPLVDILGKSMIRRVYEQVGKAEKIEEVIVATDDKRIFDHVRSFGGAVLMTSPAHRSGTDRCAEVLRQLVSDADAASQYLVVNIQGDEPLIHPGQINQLVALMQENNAFSIGTLVRSLSDSTLAHNPDVVKVVKTKEGKALYFSRSLIPFIRGDRLSTTSFFRHLGLYAYRGDVLLKIAGLPPGMLEQQESLEQLRWLEYGYTIGVAETSFEAHGVDRPEDIRRIIKLLENH
jgi:3-deoxy-manno-octulosonate cytidylyltransferase (CMP-KDO synthetase)